MKTIKGLLILSVFVITSAYAQEENPDYFMATMHDSVKCRVIKLANGKLTYVVGENRKILDIDSLIDLNIVDKSKIVNPLNVKIKEPEEGYAYVYFYRPYTSLKAGSGCKIRYNRKKFINLKTSSCYRHKIKAGEKHTYTKRGSLKDYVIDVYAENKAVYYIKAKLGKSRDMTVMGMNNGFGVNSGFGGMSTHKVAGEKKIVRANSNIAKYLIMNMTSYSPRY